MRVIEYLNGVEPAAVSAAYAAAYSDGDCSPDEFAQFVATMNRKICVSRTDGMRVILKHVIERWSEHPGCGEDEDYIDVGGVDAEHSNWSLSFTPWGEWKLMEVEDASGKSLTPAEIAAHLYYEITWHGTEEDALERQTGLLDQVEAIERGTAKLVPFKPEDFA